MLLLHQSGSVKVGEVIRYTVTYTPAVDRILPSPPHLHLKIKNTSAIALRAAFVHGPYTLYAAAYPSTYHPNEKFANPRRDGIPEFEPNLKAGGSFYSLLSVPEEVRLSAGSARKSLSQEDPNTVIKSVTWIIEIASQVIFSNSAAVHYEVMLGRDEKSLTFGFPSVSGGGVNPGRVSDHQESQGAKDGSHNAQPRGIYSKAIHLSVDDTASLWNVPKFPDWDDGGEQRSKAHNADAPVEKAQEPKDQYEGKTRRAEQGAKKVHLVLLTHGLHSNLGADMLYLKESIDAAAKQAKEDRQARRKRAREQKKASLQTQGLERKTSRVSSRTGSEPTVEAENDACGSDEDDEEVIVRGFSGNATKTERGIKYLGKRLAKYVLSMTYPDQPYLPVTKSAQNVFMKAMSSQPSEEHHGQPAHHNSTIYKDSAKRVSAYKITSISFIGHSLGGLVQTYAVAYIQKHSPEFFNLIKPINFIALATPFLGLSNENPLYVKFALDFGLVGRTGQDLGLTWRPPTLARSGWGAIVGSLGESAHKRIEGERSPDSKPLLRILPTGPAHTALKKFRNRTVYSNVVNDGIVPLRTSCLLFLDWQGLGRVEKARRENGFVGTMAGWTWSEFTGANSSTPHRSKASWADDFGSESENPNSGANTPTEQGHGEVVPGADESANLEDDTRSLKGVDAHVLKSPLSESPPAMDGAEDLKSSTTKNNGNPLSSLFDFFKPSSSSKSHNHAPKSNRIYSRSQTLNFDGSGDNRDLEDRPKATRGDSVFGENESLSAPPKTTFFEAAGDLLNPPMPSVEFLLDPSKRPRTIFHDRVYHPEDIPPPPLKRRQGSRISRPDSNSSKIAPGTPLSNSGTLKPPAHQDSTMSARNYDDAAHTDPDRDPQEVVDTSAMKVEEKIARAYHLDLSWRKVLVRLEPDAHNNIIVRRMFANAYGWPVVKHLVDTHFSDQAIAKTRDSDTNSHERAKGGNKKPSVSGDETKESSTTDSGMQDSLDGQDPKPHSAAAKGKEIESASRINSWGSEAQDKVPAMELGMGPRSMTMPERPGAVVRKGSATWSDADFDSGDDDDSAPTSPAPEKEKPSGGGFSWTEAIAGRGRSRSRSPRLSSGFSHDGAEDGESSRNDQGQQQSNKPLGIIDSLLAYNAGSDVSGGNNRHKDSADSPQPSGTMPEAVESITQKVAQSINFTGSGPSGK